MTIVKMKNFIKPQLFLRLGQDSSSGHRVIVSKTHFFCISKPSKPTPTV